MPTSSRMGARLIGIEMARACIETFLATPFGGGRHQRRVDKLSHPISPRSPHEQPPSLRLPATSSPTASSPTALRQADPAIADAIAAELDRQQNQIELIASENIVSRAVLEAQGSVLTNKYAEGYPGRRYYQGCGLSDSVETLAIERAKQLFGCGFANVQPHSGAQANGAVMLALTRPGDTIMGLDLDAGGHLTHGAKPAMSGKWFNAVQYGVRRDDQLIDFDQVEALAREHKPTLIITGGSAYPRHIDFAALPRDRRRGRRAVHGRHGPFRRPRRGRRCTPSRSATPMSSRPPPTRPCAARAAAWS